MGSTQAANVIFINNTICNRTSYIISIASEWNDTECYSSIVKILNCLILCHSCLNTFVIHLKPVYLDT